MRRNGWLSLLFTLVFVVGAISDAAARPRHGRHHTKAVVADKGGGGHNTSGESPGQGSDKGGSAGATQSVSQGNGNGNNGQGNGNGNNGQGNGNGNAGSDSPQGKGSDDTSTASGPQADQPKDDDNPAKGDDKPKGDDQSPKGAPPVADPTIAGDVPTGLLGAPRISLGTLPEALQPTAGTNALVAPQAGRVLVQSDDGRFVPMGGPGRIPVGAFVDANQGVVAIVNRLPDGSSQTAAFAGAKFQLRKTADGTITAVLRGSSFREICGKVTAAADDGAPGRRVPTASAARARSRKVVRSLWASDKGGKYQTYGRNSVATVRGTVWQTVDRCDGTLIRVAEGEVVVHDRRTHKDVVVTAGHSYLALDPEA